MNPIYRRREHAACLAGGHHVDIQSVKSLGMLAERLGQSGTAFNVFGDRAEDILQRPGLLLLFEDVQATEDRQAGILQRRELSRELGQHLRAHAANREADFLLFSRRTGPGLGAALFADAGGEVPQVSNFG